jgi:CHC2-type zinc finger protein
MFGLAGKPAKSCRSPFRPDQNPSFSVSEDGLLFNDFATGHGGDNIDFLGEIRGSTKSEAFPELLKMAGESAEKVQEPALAKKRETLKLEGLELCSDTDLERISALRSIPIEGLRLAAERRLLFSYEHPFQGRCWLVSDAAKRSASCRRFDGKRFDFREPEDGKKQGPKSKSWKGSLKNWPIGIAQAGPYPAIALCEGEPDFLSAFYLAWAGGVETLVAPVCMGGAACRIHEDALPLFRKKRIRIFGHVDKEGQQAVRKWAEQLWSVQAEVDDFDFCGLIRGDGKAVADLNDFLLADYKKSGCGIEITTGAFDFALERQG